MRLKTGTQVAVCFRPGTPVRYGTVVWAPRPEAHAGAVFYRIQFDGPKTNQFEPDTVKVYGRDLTPIDPKLHEQWETEWAKAPFIDRSWTKQV